jgi:hypothetical protein
MNQKRVKYLLIGGVAVVWGLIIYRVVDGLSPDDNLPALNAPNAVATSYVPLSDSFTLIADYTDPFIPGSDTVDAEVELTAKPVAAPAPPPPVINKPPADTYKEGTIQYEGMISNPARKLKLGTITINGKEMLVKEKDKVEEYVIQKISAETIVIKYKNKSITIRKGQ